MRTPISRFLSHRYKIWHTTCVMVLHLVNSLFSTVVNQPPRINPYNCKKKGPWKNPQRPPKMHPWRDYRRFPTTARPSPRISADNSTSSSTTESTGGAAGVDDGQRACRRAARGRASCPAAASARKRRRTAARRERGRLTTTTSDPFRVFARSPADVVRQPRLG